MSKNPVIDEIREAAHKLAKSCDYDVHRIAEHYREVQEQYKDRIVHRPQIKPHFPEDEDTEDARSAQKKSAA